jgi:hypothetical protein
VASDPASALLACSRNGYVCCPSLHRDHTVGEVVALVDRMRAAALIAQPGYGADADRHDLFGHRVLNFVAGQRTASTTPASSASTPLPMVWFPGSKPEDAAVMLPDLRIDKFAQIRFEAFVRAFLIGTHQARIAHHIGGEDRGQSAGGGRGGHCSGGANSRVEFNLLPAVLANSLRSARRDSSNSSTPVAASAAWAELFRS